MTCAVICPLYLTGEDRVGYLHEMVDTLLRQTDDGWHLVVVDDRSPSPLTPDVLSDLRHELGSRLTVLQMTANSGQGVCRNVGARWAWKRGLPYCLYLDCDDRADLRRVEVVRATMAADSDVAFVYSSFDLIDERGAPVPTSEVAPSIREILDAHRAAPAQGRGAWQALGTTLGYSTLTSVVSVRTWLVISQPFPDTFVSEDQHAWLRMTAATDGVLFDATTRGQYRITTDGSGSNVRRRIGDGYYRQKAWVDTRGFLSATRIALARATIDETEVSGLLARFLSRSATTLDSQGEGDTAREYRNLARRVRGSGCADALRTLPTRPPLFRPPRSAVGRAAPGAE